MPKPEPFPKPTEIKARLTNADMDYRYNMVIQAHEFKIDDQWTTEDALAQARLRQWGDEEVPFQWNLALRWLGATFKWHPWKDLDIQPEMPQSEADINWPVYAAIQRMMLDHPPEQPVFVIPPQPLGTLAPPELLAYQPSIFHRVVPGHDGGRARMVQEARKSGKVAVMQTKRAVEYDNDERFYICGETTTESELWVRMYAAFLDNPYMVADPEIEIDDEEPFPLPDAEEIYNRIYTEYINTAIPFSVYRIIADLYWQDLPLDVADKLIRTSYNQTAKRVTEKLVAAGFTSNARRRWSNTEALMDYQNANAPATCAHDVSVPPGWTTEANGKSPAGGKCLKCGTQIPLYPVTA